MNTPRAFRFCSASALEQLQRRVSAAFSAWAQGRFEADSLPPFQVEAAACKAPAVNAACEVRLPCLSAHGAYGTFWLDAEQAAAMQVLLFGAAARSGSMAAEIAQASLAELVEAIAGAAPGPCPQEMIDLSVPGRALAAARIRCEDVALEFLVELPDPNLLPRRPSQARDLATSYASALLSHQVNVRATLGTVEFDLGTLHLLRPGDILRLDKRLDEPAELDVAGERLHCEAYLVASGERKAVELSKPQNPLPKDLGHA